MLLELLYPLLLLLLVFDGREFPWSLCAEHLVLFLELLDLLLQLAYLNVLEFQFLLNVVQVLLLRTPHRHVHVLLRALR